MAVLKARESSSDTFKPVGMMGVGNASQSQRGLMTAQDKVKVDSIGSVPSGETDTLWDKIDTLFNPTPVTVSSSLQTPTVNAYQIGKMVYGCIEFPRVAMTAHSWLEIGTISQPPTANIQVPSVNTANGNFAGIVQIRTDGIIRVYPSESASQGALSFTFSYTI